VHIKRIERCGIMSPCRDENSFFFTLLSEERMREELHETEVARASLSLLQLNLSRNVACYLARTGNIFSEKIHELKRIVSELKEHTEGKKNITVLIGRSGVGKTHIVNKILKMFKPSDKEYSQMYEHKNKKRKAESLEVYAIPDPENFFSDFSTNIFLRHSKLQMEHATLRKYFMVSSEKVSQLDNSFFLLPETEISTAANIPFRIVYGSELRVTLVFDQVQTIQSLLELLKNSVQNSRMVIEDETHCRTSFHSDTKMHSFEKNGTNDALLRKALSILGLHPNTNITDIVLKKVCVPKDLRYFLGTCVSFTPRNYSSFEQQVKEVKNFIFHNSHNKFSHIIRFVVIQYPSNFFINGLELIDTPGFNLKSSFDSKMMHSGAINSASTIIHVCDERKVDDGFRTLLLEYLRDENFHHKRKRFFIVNNLRDPYSSKFEKKLILLRLRELASLEYLATNNLRLYDDFRKNCSVFVYSKSQDISESGITKLTDVLCTDSSYRFQDNGDDSHRIRALLAKTVPACRFLLEEVHNFSWCHENFFGELVYCMLLFSKFIKSNMYRRAFHSDEQYLSEERVSCAYEKLLDFHSNTFLSIDMCTELGLVFGATPTKIAHTFSEISHCKEKIVKYYFLAIYVRGLKEYTKSSIQKTFESFLKNFLDEVLPFVPQQVLSIRANTNGDNLRKRLLQNYVFCLRRKIMEEFSFLFTEIWQEQFECSLQNSLKQLKNDVGTRNCKPLHFVFMNDHLNRSIRSAVLDYCFINLQENFSNIMEKCIMLCSDFTKIVIQNLDQELSHFVLDTLIINLEYLPMVETFLSTTEVQFLDLGTVGKMNSKICHTSWTRNNYVTLFRRLPDLIDSNFEERGIEQIFNCIWSVRSTESDQKNLLKSLKSKIISSCNLFGNDARVFSWISSVLNLCKIPRYSPPKDSNISKSSDFSHVFSSRRRAILKGLSFIVSKINDDVFFNEWGSDVLVTLYFFMEISCNNVIVDICESNLNSGIQKWQTLNSHLEFCAGPEDVKYFLEGIFVLYKLSRKHVKLRKQIYAKINRLHSSTLLTINRQNNKANNLHETKAMELNDDMVWSFFFRENGVHIENGSEIDLDIRCHSMNASLHFSNTTRNNLFREHSYFVTHKIFTKSEWCLYSLIPEEWLFEISFMKFNLPNFIKVRDIEITGEFVQALKSAGISELDEDIQWATKFLISTQHSDGSWLECEINDRKYHATVCAVGALLDHNYKYRRHSNCKNLLT